MKIQTELFDKLNAEGAERLATLQLLLASALPMQECTVLNTTDKTRETLREAFKSQCFEILAVLAGYGFSTPEETYKDDLIWAARDLIKALSDSQSDLARAENSWRVPKSGDMVKLLRLTPGMPSYFRCGQLYKVDSLTLHCPARVPQNDFKTESEFAVMLRDEQSSVWLASLKDVEVVNE